MTEQLNLEFNRRPFFLFCVESRLPEKKQLRERERNRPERIEYDHKLGAVIRIYGSKSLVLIDESGWELIKYCLDGGSKSGCDPAEVPSARECAPRKGKKIDGQRQGKRAKRENLVARRRKGEKELIAPMIFTGSLHAEGFEGWLNLYYHR